MGNNQGALDPVKGEGWGLDPVRGGKRNCVEGGTCSSDAEELDQVEVEPGPRGW